jgi:AcrR family transcriptional regulator
MTLPTGLDVAPREPRGRRTHRAILDAARGLFLAQGYHGTGMRQVAQVAGLTLGALYNHFPSKDALWEEVFRVANPFGEVPVALGGAEGTTTEALLKDAARRLHAALREHPEHLRLALIELLEFNGRHIAPILAANAPWVSAFEQRCRDLEGGLRPLPPFLVQRTFLGLLSAWFFTETLFMGKMPPSLASLRIEDAVDVFLHGALARPVTTP